MGTWTSGWGRTLWFPIREAENRLGHDDREDRESKMDAITLLTADHRTVERLYDEFRAAGGDTARRTELRNQIVRELSVHAAIEEEYLYPAVTEAVQGGADLTQHSVEEHQEIKVTLAGVDRMDPADPQLDGALKELLAEVTHHVREEESELFPQLRAALGDHRLAELGEQLERAKATAPTRPHPEIPPNATVEKLTGPAVAAVDRIRDLGR